MARAPLRRSRCSACTRRSSSNAAKHIPPRRQPTSWRTSRRLDRTTREAFRQWALANLLPRVAVADPDQAQLDPDTRRRPCRPWPADLVGTLEGQGSRQRPSPGLSREGRALMARDVVGLLACNVLFLAAGAGLLRLLLGVAHPSRPDPHARGGIPRRHRGRRGGAPARPRARITVQSLGRDRRLRGLRVGRSCGQRPGGPRPPAVLACRPISGLRRSLSWESSPSWPSTSGSSRSGVWDACGPVDGEGTSARRLRRAERGCARPSRTLPSPGTRITPCSCRRSRPPTSRSWGTSTRVQIHVQFWLIYAGFLLALLELLRGRVREVLVWPFVLAVALAPAAQIQNRFGARQRPGRASSLRWRASSPGAGSSTPTAWP